MIMKKTEFNKFIEYLSPIFILSYFFFHNIVLVLIGIFFSLYLINLNYIIKLIATMNKNQFFKNLVSDFYKNNKLPKSDYVNAQSPEEGSKYTLAEAIEELGFIPSINSKNDNNTI